MRRTCATQASVMGISDSGRTAGEEGTRAVAQQTRRLRNSLISLGVFFALVAALLLGIPGLRAAADRISDAKAPWIVLACALELISCIGYVVLFDAVFDR